MRPDAPPGYRSSMSALRLLPVAAMVVLALAGCTLTDAGSGLASDRAATESSQQAVVIDQAAVLAELGPVPPDPEFTDEVVDDYVTRWLDWQWNNVLASYPDAVRPSVAEIERSTGGNPRWTQCGDQARAAGLDPRAFAIAAFVCSAEYPSVPYGTLSKDQARYLYDYWTRFVVPCYADSGYRDTSIPPTREFFAENWPFQNWSPSPSRGGVGAGGPDFDTVVANCPAMPEGLDG
jgi:hypothetical protein